MIRRVVLLLAVSLLASGPFGQEDKQELTHKEVQGSNVYGRAAIALSPPTEAGRWTGTWTYVSRDHRFALWLSEDDGKVIAKVRYGGNGRINEGFETDWAGSAAYTVQNKPASFDLTLLEVDANHMTADWRWDLDMHGSARRESADLEIYRAGDGRQMVVFFKGFSRVIESGGRTMSSSSPQAWTFTKRSKRLVLWEELPL